jgi:hypothetical protein
MKPPRKPPPTVSWPWDAIQLDPDELSAIKAMIFSHPVAFGLLCEKLCGERRLSFTIIPGSSADGARATDFAEGKRWIARTLRQIAAMKMPGPSPPVDSGPHAIPRGPPPED